VCVCPEYGVACKLLSRCEAAFLVQHNVTALASGACRRRACPAVPSALRSCSRYGQYGPSVCLCVLHASTASMRAFSVNSRGKQRCAAEADTICRVTTVFARLSCERRRAPTRLLHLRHLRCWRLAMPGASKVSVLGLRLCFIALAVVRRRARASSRPTVQHVAKASQGCSGSGRSFRRHRRLSPPTAT
jgi:hypothetical protein